MQSSPLTANEKDVYIRKNGIGYVLAWGDEEKRVTPGEALGLLTSLLHTLPDIPNGVELAALISYGPRVTIRRLWSHHRNTVKQDRFQAFIYVKNNLVHRCDSCSSPESALALASHDYDRPLEISKIETAPGSKEVAERKALAWIIEDYVRRKGTTVPELYKAIGVCGRVPEDLNLEVVVDDH